MECARINPKNPQGDYLLRPTYDLLDMWEVFTEDKEIFEDAPLRFIHVTRCARNKAFLSLRTNSISSPKSGYGYRGKDKIVLLPFLFWNACGYLFQRTNKKDLDELADILLRKGNLYIRLTIISIYFYPYSFTCPVQYIPWSLLESKTVSWFHCRWIWRTIFSWQEHI